MEYTAQEPKKDNPGKIAQASDNEVVSIFEKNYPNARTLLQGYLDIKVKHLDNEHGREYNKHHAKYCEKPITLESFSYDPRLKS